MSVPELAFRRKIITTSRKIESRYPEMVPTHHEQIDIDLRPNLHLSRSTFPAPFIENKSFRITKSNSEKPFLVPSKQNIDYSALFQKKVVGLKGSKVSTFLTNLKPNKKSKGPQGQESKSKPPFSPAKHFEKKIQTLLQQRVDICIQTIDMTKGLNQKDLDAFVLLLNQSQQLRKKKAVSRWQTFNTEKFIKIYSSQYFD